MIRARANGGLVMSRVLLAAIVCCWVFAQSRDEVYGAEKTATEADYYNIVPIPIPGDVYLEAGALEWLPDGKLAVSSRRGDIYMVEGAVAKPLDEQNVTFTKFAGGLHEVLGLAVQDGKLYATQRGEVTRLTDTDGDGRADLLETVSDFWGINGDYHEYAFGSSFDRDGYIWVVLCLTGSGGAADNSPFRGWCFRVAADGTTIPTCSGIRSPGGIGMNAAGDMFYTDNQGPWNGTCALKHLKPGSFQGNPTGNKYYALTDAIGPRPPEPKSGSRIHIEEKRVPQLVPSAILFPYQKMGQSASGVATDTTGGKFGPFAGQMFVGDQTHSTVMRVFLEKVNGVYQGACFPFLSGFGSGSLSLKFTPDGSFFVGGTNRGWGSRGNKPYSLDRAVWTGELPFEIHEMRARPDGFELTFTKPVDADTAKQLGSYQLSTYTYIYQGSYGSPEVDHTKPTIKTASVSADRRRVRLVIDGLQLGHVHELHVPGIRSSDGLPLLHPQAYYTLNRIPAAPSIAVGGKPYVISNIEFSASDAEVKGVLFYRSVGEASFQRATVETSTDGKRVAVIPANATDRAFEYYIEFSVPGQPPVKEPSDGSTAPIKVVPDIQPPSAVAEIKANEVSDLALTLRWTAASDDKGIDGYRISAGMQDGFPFSADAEKAIVPGDSLEWTDTNPPAGKTVWYAVEAIDVAGRVGPPSYFKIDVPANRPPTNRLELSAFAAGERAYLRWSGPLESDIVALEILRSEGSEGKFETIKRIGEVQTTSFVDEGLREDIVYRYAIRLMDRGDLSSAPSEPQSVLAGLYIKRINCGGDEMVGPDGIPWEADNKNSAGTGRWRTKAAIADAGDVPAGVYQSERWSNGLLRYKFDVKPGRYLVVLHFAEINPKFSVANKRTFDVFVDDDKVHAAVDVFAAAGGNRAWQLNCKVDATDQPLQVELRKIKVGPSLKGIEIRALP